MATYGDESIDSYLYSSYNPYSCRYLNPKSRGVGWRHKNYLANYGDAETYFDNHQRAQLKSILSQINPDLTPRLRKANTKDVGVQVNPKTDASVQCSLGPRTLLARKREALRRKQENQSLGSPVGSTVRFPRALGVYSPIASRRLFSFAELDKEDEDPDPAPAAEPPEPAEKSEGTGGEEDKASAEDKAEKTTEATGSPKKDVNAKEEQSSESEKNPKIEEGAKSKARVRFQVS